MRDERSSYLRSRTKTTKTAALLPLAANALRHVIYSGVRTIKSSTVELIIDAIIELLPGKDGNLLKPLVEDLPKTLRALLEHQPHVESLSGDCWDAAVDFCIESLSSIFVEPEAEPPNSWSTGISSRGRTPLPFESTDGPPRPSPRDSSSRNNRITNELTHTAEELVYCLQLLVKASNAPILDKAESVLMSLIHFLQQKTGRGNAAALTAINSVLPRITLQASHLTEQVLCDLIPLMTSMWAEALLRDEIMITLIHAEPHIRHILNNSRDDSFSIDLEALVETMYTDYRRRQETTTHQYLEEDHLCFRNIGGTGKDAHPLSTSAFALDPDHVRYEGLWATAATIARLSFLVDKRKRRLVQEREDGEGGMVKRLRMTNHFQEYLRHVSETRSNAKRSALQILAFMVQEGPVDADDIHSMLERLIPCISDENSIHSSWATIGLAA